MERMSSPPILPLEGGCHCGGVRFRVTSAKRRIDDCNCSICRKKAFLHWIVPRPEFEQLRGDELLGEYRFGTGVARHTFCKRCGVHAFYVPRSHPTGVSVNYRCLDGSAEPSFAARHGFEIVAFDGQNWEANVERIRT
ncbi:MAG: GFA family protein [Myxococcales bacterium]|nr:GFA family protein [Myxococcales bacterium]